MPSVGATDAPSSSPVPEFIEVRLSELYMSWVSTDTTPPTDEQFEQLRLLSIDNFAGVFVDYYANDPNIGFVSIDLIVRSTASGVDAQFPDVRYNLYMELEDAILTFTGTSVGIQTPNELYEVYKTGISKEFLLEMRAMLAGTPFGSVTEGYTERPGTPP